MGRLTDLMRKLRSLGTETRPDCLVPKARAGMPAGFNPLDQHSLLGHRALDTDAHARRIEAATRTTRHYSIEVTLDATPNGHAMMRVILDHHVTVLANVLKHRGGTVKMTEHKPATAPSSIMTVKKALRRVYDLANAEYDDRRESTAYEQAVYDELAIATVWEMILELPNDEQV